MGTDCLITEVKKNLKYLKRLKFDSRFYFLSLFYINIKINTWLWRSTAILATLWFRGMLDLVHGTSWHYAYYEYKKKFVGFFFRFLSSQCLAISGGLNIGQFEESVTPGDLEYRSILKIQNHDTPSLYGAPPHQKLNWSSEK